jgi:signal transduction histidine kinase
MTIRLRLTAWYALILIVSLVLISGGAFQEIYEQLSHQKRARSQQRAFDEVLEMFFEVGLPALVLGLAGGWWLTRRALAPVASITRAAETITERSLDEQLPRTGNGDELDRLAQVLNGMIARLRDSFSRVRDFTLHASHELKTPLTVMQGELETALAEENLPAGQREGLLSQLDEVQRLSRIADGLTLLTKADAGLVTLTKEPLRLDELVRDTIADARILAEPQALRVESGPCEQLTVVGDRHRLRQLLLNLTDNAIKYNRTAGSVYIALRRAGDDAEITLSNTGPGISEEALPRVFDRFFRGDPSHNSNIEGCGLGLSIAQWIVSAHKGAIKIESVKDKLTTVTVRLPLSS